VSQCGEAGLARLDPRKRFKQNLILNFKGFGILARLGEILQGDLEGIWTLEFFLNSSRLLNDF
jgi:hypothetical protein